MSRLYAPRSPHVSTLPDWFWQRELDNLAARLAEIGPLPRLLGSSTDPAGRPGAPTSSPAISPLVPTTVVVFDGIELTLPTEWTPLSALKSVFLHAQRRARSNTNHNPIIAAPWWAMPIDLRKRERGEFAAIRGRPDTGLLTLNDLTLDDFPTEAWNWCDFGCGGDPDHLWYIPSGLDLFKVHFRAVTAPAI